MYTAHLQGVSKHFYIGCQIAESGNSLQSVGVSGEVQAAADCVCCLNDSKVLTLIQAGGTILALGCLAVAAGL